MGIAGGQEARAAARTAVGKARVRVALTPGSEPGAPRLGRVEVPGVRVPFPGAGLEAPAPPPPRRLPWESAALRRAPCLQGSLTFLLLMSERPGLTLLRRVARLHKGS